MINKVNYSVIEKECLTQEEKEKEMNFPEELIEKVQASYRKYLKEEEIERKEMYGEVEKRVKNWISSYNEADFSPLYRNSLWKDIEDLKGSETKYHRCYEDGGVTEQYEAIMGSDLLMKYPGSKLEKVFNDILENIPLELPQQLSE